MEKMFNFSQYIYSRLLLYVDGLMQERRTSIANALELRLALTYHVCIDIRELGYHQTQELNMAYSVPGYYLIANGTK